jgi:hypothetical protein
MWDVEGVEGWQLDVKEIAGIKMSWEILRYQIVTDDLWDHHRRYRLCPPIPCHAMVACGTQPIHSIDPFLTPAFI